jgi:general secretion pathway protein D
VTNIWRQALGTLLILAMLAGCAAHLHREGLAAMSRGDYETGIANLSQAIVRDPNNVRFRMDYATARESAVQTLIAEADSARRANQPDTASALYRRVLALDPVNSRARHGLDGIEGDKRHGATLDAARQDLERKDYDAAETKVLEILNEDPGYVPAQTLATVIRDARVPIAVAPHLKPHGNRKVTLQLRDAPTKMVFEVLQRETGINFILDKDVKTDSKTSIFVQDVPVEDAIELVLDQNALARQILSDNTVLIYPNIASKQKDYEQQIVRTFYLTNAAPKDVENMLKTVLAAKTLFMDERANAVVIRDTPETVRMAERLVASIDIAEPEVMLEVEVLEISRSAIQDLGIQYPTSATLSPTSVLGTAAGASTGGSTLFLWDLAHQNSKSITITPPSVTLNAMKQAGVANTLASPRIRARNKEKAKVLIGSREPVITNSTTPTAGGTAVVTGSVQYLDVGLTLEAQPTIYLDGDVAIKLNLEVSSILKQITTTSGTVAYEIGTRNANTLLRLKDGETQVLGGLIQQSDTRTANSIPLLGEIPILSHLFGTHHTDKEKDEIVLSVTPHIIRMQPHPSADNIQFWYGTETRHALPGAGSGGGTAAPAGGSVAPAAAPQSVDPTQMYVQPVTPMPPPPAAPPVSPPSNSVPIGQRDAPGSAIAPVPRQAEASARAAGAGAGADAAPALGAAAQGAAAAPAAAATDVTTVAGATGATGAAAATAGTNTAAVVAGGTIAATGAVAAAAAATPSAVSATPASAAQTGIPIAAPPAAVPSNAAPAAGGAPGGGSALSLDGPREAKVGEEFPVTVRLSTDQSITRLRAQLRFDSSALQLLSADTGDMVPAAAGSPKVQTRGGGAQLDVSTTADEPVQGTGSLMVVNFRAMQPRPASDISAMLNVLGASGAAVGNSSAAPLKLAILAAK